MILDIDVVGAAKVRHHVMHHLPPTDPLRMGYMDVFINPPSMEELERRLRSRGDTGEEQIRLRLDRAVWEMEQSAQYNYVVINGDVETCADEIINIIAKTCGEE